MILVTFSELLGKKRKKIADVIRNTGVTRPTLTALYYGGGSGINFDTLDKLCRYFQVQPGEILHFVNADVKEVNITEIFEDGSDALDFNGEVIFTPSFLGKQQFSGYINGYRQREYGELKGAATLKIPFKLSELGIPPQLQDGYFDYLTSEISDAVGQYFESDYPGGIDVDTILG
jgi:putative transcriptional regulator